MQLSTDNPDVPLIEVRLGVAARLNKGPLPALLGFGTAVTSASPMQRLDRLRDASRRNPASVTSTFLRIEWGAYGERACISFYWWG